MFKKIIVILILTVIVWTNTVKVNGLTKIANLNGGYNVVQGGCSDGKNFYFAKISGDWAEIHKRELSNPKSDILCVRENKDTKYRLRHCNDMAFDEKNNRIIVVSYSDKDSSTFGNLTFVNPETLIATSQIKLKNADDKPIRIVGIEVLGDNYIGIDGSNFYIFDSNFKFIGEHSRGIFSSESIQKKYEKIYGEGHLCTQGLAVDKDYIYYLTPYSFKNNDVNYYQNVALRFTHDFVPIDEMQFNVYSEGQSLFFVENIGYMLFYKSNEMYRINRNIFRIIKGTIDSMVLSVKSIFK
jgi:hypothetical protein